MHNQRGVVSSVLPGLSLSPTGVQQADAVANALRGSVLAVYASPALRAVQTGERVAARFGAPLVVDDRLVEIAVGSVEGMDAMEGLRILDFGWNRWIQDGVLNEPVAPDGERASDALERFRAFLTQVEVAHPGDVTVAVISHGGLLQLSIPLLSANLDNGHGRTHWLRNAQTVEARTVPGGLWCESWAETAIEVPTAASNPEEEALAGGGSTVVTRLGETVRRPVRPWTPTVHRLLRHLRVAGFCGAPMVHGIDERGHEILDYIPGVVGHYPLSEDVRSETALRSAGRLLREYHDATVGIADTSGDHWMFPALEPKEVICHSDFAPYNCVFEGKRAVAIIDFDTARPGPRAWDLAYALYRFAPFAGPENVDSFGDVAQQAARARAFLDAYGATPHLRADSVATLVPRLRTLVEFMRDAAGDGDEQFQQHINDGHLVLYLADIAYIEANLAYIASLVHGDGIGMPLSGYPQSPS
jgi:broad specificity phosphatase PhoE/tRNA A-37 threonylcarbamoyl transferase component Bud32